MNTREEKAKIVMDGIEDLFRGEKELSHMTGDIELCGKTADEVIRRINERKAKEGK